MSSLAPSPVQKQHYSRKGFQREGHEIMKKRDKPHIGHELIKKDVIFPSGGTRGNKTKTLKVPCHAFLVITRSLVCYEGLYACKRSAESQTLKVHPVASKTLTQKIPVYAAPECLVGDFSVSICFLKKMDQSAELLTHQDPLAN